MDQTDVSRSVEFSLCFSQFFFLVFCLNVTVCFETAATTETTSEIAMTPTSGTPATVETVPTECKPWWSRWYNTPLTSAGDFERLDDLEAEGKLPCGRHKITNIECNFYRNVTR